MDENPNIQLRDEWRWGVSYDIAQRDAQSFEFKRHLQERKKIKKTQDTIAGFFFPGQKTGVAGLWATACLLRKNLGMRDVCILNELPMPRK